MEELVEMVGTCFDWLHWTKINNDFLTLHKVMEYIILCDGDNDYKMPHMSKEKLERSGQFPMSIKILEKVKAKYRCNN